MQPIYRSLSQRVGVEFHGDSITIIFRDKGNTVTIPRHLRDYGYTWVLSALTVLERVMLEKWNKEIPEMRQ